VRVMECLVRLAVASFVCQLVKVNLVQKLLRSESFLTAFSSKYSIKSWLFDHVPRF
jgi:hypothetical protein